jgi:thioredoxin reductase (NADPH)
VNSIDVRDEAAPPETPDVVGAYPRLDERQMALLDRNGERRPTVKDEVLCRAGQTGCDFYIVTRGKIAVVEGEGADASILAVHGPGRFLGALDLLTHGTALADEVVCEEGEVLAVAVPTLRRLVGEDPSLGDVIFRAFLTRRSMLIEVGAGLRIIGSRFSPETRRLREFVARNRLPHRWIDLEEDAEAHALLHELGIPPEDTPVVIVGHDVVLRNPTNAALAGRVGLRAPVPAESVADLLIIGAGPAGLAAAVYGASEGLRTLVIDSVAVGGQAATTPRIENYLGFPSGLSGAELADRAVVQAEKFGAILTVPSEAGALGHSEPLMTVRLDEGTEISARSVLLATGARYRKLSVERLEEFEGTSVFYAATEIELQACKGDVVVVVGGGNSAGQAALILARFAADVHLVVRHEDLGRDMSYYLAAHLERCREVEIHRHSEVTELIGDDGRLRVVALRDNRTGETGTIDATHLFVFIGADPNTHWLDGAVELDDHGFVLTGLDQCAASPLATSAPGVFAAGDVRHGSVKRVAAAVGEGAMAVRMVHEHLARVGRA